MSNITGDNRIANNLWTTDVGQSLVGQKFNDILHAVHNNTTMKGGVGKDHFHVNMTTDKAVTGTKILDFNATQSDRLVLDGITNYDSSKLSIALNANGNDYDIFYGGTLAATVNLQYTNAQDQVVDWNPDLEQAKAAITKMVRGGQADANADYLYGTDAAQVFAPRSIARKTNIVSFDPAKDSLGLAAIPLAYDGLGPISGFVKVNIMGEGNSRYISILGTGRELMTISLKPGAVTDENLAKVVEDAETEIGLRF